MDESGVLTVGTSLRLYWDMDGSLCFDWQDDGVETWLPAADLDALIAALTTLREQRQAEGGSR